MNNFLIIGQYHRLIDQEINNIINDSNNVFYYDMESDDITKVLDEMNFISLFDDKKIIILKNYVQKKKKQSESDEENQEEDKSSEIESKIISYLENPNPQVIFIIITSSKLDDRKKITKLLNKQSKVIDFEEIPNYEMCKAIIKFFSKNGYLCHNVNAELIREKCLGNYDLIFNECEKLIIACDDTKEITEECIDNIISDYIGDNFFKIKDLIVNKKIKQAYQLLSNHLLAKKSLIPFLTLLANEYSLIYMVKNLKESNVELMKELKIKEYPIKLARNSANNFHNDELIDNIYYLADLDYKIKSGNIDEEIGFNLFLLHIIKGEI